VLSRTSSEVAPWYIVPADAKWYRNLVVSSVVVQKLEELGMRYPEPEDNLSAVVVE
jgi:polyphosphate kinase 2 (PPK2 family)